MKPLVFTGVMRDQIRGKKHYNFYSLRADGVRICQDVSYYFTSKHDGPCTWGYYGEGSLKLSLVLLGISICHAGFSPLNDSPGYNSAVVWNGHPYFACRISGWIFKHATVLRLYRKFAKEVLAKLPANWSMTTDDINAWIKNEKQTTKSTKAKSKARSKR